MMDFCILGSGIAGSTIANLISRKYSVAVFDKARGPGGRSSNKRYKLSLGFDHGVQYISPKSNSFKKFVEKLYKKKILKLWDGNHLDFTFKKNNDLKYIGKKANNDICKYQLKNINQYYLSNIIKINRLKGFWEITLENKKKYQFKALIITCPYPQVKKLAKKYLTNRMLKLNVKMEPNITVMVTIKNQEMLHISSIKFNDNILAWAANENSKKRFKSKNNLWTLQSTVNWSQKKINLYKGNNRISQELLSRFLSLTGIKKDNIIFKLIHGWKYSYNTSKTNLECCWDNKIKLGICADWFLGPKVENAWLSANSLFKKIKKNPL